MSDLISRQEAIDALYKMLHDCFWADDEELDAVITTLNDLPSAQPEKVDTPTVDTPTVDTPTCEDAVSRQAVYNVLDKMPVRGFKKDGETIHGLISLSQVNSAIINLPSVQPTLYGYNIEHLELIARVLQKEDLPPERLVEILTDIGRIVAIVKDEFEEALRKAVEQCAI